MTKEYREPPTQGDDQTQKTPKKIREWWIRPNGDDYGGPDDISSKKRAGFVHVREVSESEVVFTYPPNGLGREDVVALHSLVASGATRIVFSVPSGLEINAVSAHQVTPNPDPSPSSAVADDVKAARQDALNFIREIGADCEGVSRIEGIELAEKRTWLSMAKRCKHFLSLTAGNSPAISVSSPDTKRLNWLESGEARGTHVYLPDVVSEKGTSHWTKLHHDLRAAIDCAMAAYSSPVSSVERQEQCVRCQQWTSDWVDTEQTKGRCCRACESIISSSVERDAEQ